MNISEAQIAKSKLTRRFVSQQKVSSSSQQTKFLRKTQIKQKPLEKTDKKCFCSSSPKLQKTNKLHKRIILSSKLPHESLITLVQFLPFPEPSDGRELKLMAAIQFFRHQDVLLEESTSDVAAQRVHLSTSITSWIEVLISWCCPQYFSSRCLFWRLNFPSRYFTSPIKLECTI